MPPGKPMLIQNTTINVHFDNMRVTACHELRGARDGALPFGDPSRAAILRVDIGERCAFDYTMEQSKQPLMERVHLELSRRAMFQDEYFWALEYVVTKKTHSPEAVEVIVVVHTVDCNDAPMMSEATFRSVWIRGDERSTLSCITFYRAGASKIITPW